MRDQRLLGFAKQMRREPTPFEVILWRHLGNSQLGGFKFRRQAVVGPYIADFLCSSKALIVEVDGETHDAKRDERRDDRLAELGYRVLRFTNAQVANETEGVLLTIKAALETAADRWARQPHPNPSPEGEGLRLADAVVLLSGVSATPRLDAEVLLAHALRVERVDLKVSEAPGFDELIARRLKGEPVAYITGTRGFWTIDLDVTPDVLIPRPDSETLIEAAVAHFGQRAPKRVLDLGTGSGALLLAALDQWPEATGLGVDASAAALDVARRNGARIAGARAAFRLGNWAEGIAEPFDLVLCNPPYVEDGGELGPGVREWEPHAALFAGADGLDCYRVLAEQVPQLIAPGGVACVEVGAGQFGAVKALFEAALPTSRSPAASRPPPMNGRGWTIGSQRDLGGHERCLTLS